MRENVLNTGTVYIESGRLYWNKINLGVEFLELWQQFPQYKILDIFTSCEIQRVIGWRNDYSRPKDNKEVLRQILKTADPALATLLNTLLLKIH